MNEMSKVLNVIKKVRSMIDSIYPAKRLEKTLEPSVWLEFSPLAEALGAINLGQGFPDWDPPDFLKQALQEANQNPCFHRYARSSGHLNLVEAISQKYEKQLNYKIDPLNEILVTVGASEAIYASLMTFVNPGDEVIVIEPAFDLYYSAIKMADGIVRGLSLNWNEKSQENGSDNFKINLEELENTLNEKTKVLILNTPHNPTGKVFTKKEFEEIAEILLKYPQCLVISDEVYEHLVYDDNKHVPFASIDQMKERTLSIYSAGKTFSVTGWKIGWLIGSKNLVKSIQGAQQWIVFSVSSILQEAIANALRIAEQSYRGHSTYFDWLKVSYDNKRLLLFHILNKLNFSPIMPQGSFFILSKYNALDENNLLFSSQIEELEKSGKLKINSKTKGYPDYNYSRNLALRKKVVTIPVSAFIGSKEILDPCDFSFIRFAFCKNDEIIKKCEENLSNS